MKKILSLTMAFLLSASVSLFSACEYLDGFVNNDPVSSNSQSTSPSSSEKTECTAHSFGEWETVKEASCIAGEKQRVCENCNFTETEEIPALNDFFAHTFDENTLCTTCGHQEFIESEEYIEDIIIPPQTIHFGQSVPGIIWWNKDKTYGLKISLGNPSYLFLLGYVGTPVHVRLPAYYNEAPLGTIGFSADEPEIFRNCTTLKSIYIPDTVTRIDDYAFDGCTNLETVWFSENVSAIGDYAFRNCKSLSKIILPQSLEVIFFDPFYECSSLKIYYSGSINEWSNIMFYGPVLENNIYYYSSTMPLEEGNYWHYVDGEPVIWEI